jgi:hypothetical protein
MDEPGIEGVVDGPAKLDPCHVVEKRFGYFVGAPGFEPGASCSQSKRATGLRYAPK